MAVNTTTYTWDANGNLLNDGAKTYAYDHSNRLTLVDDGQASYSYAYNGLGDRIQQTTGGNTTNYLLDTATGLTQVLDDGSNSYLYGVGRIAQYDTSGAQYFLGDALGSVRQLVDSSGEVLLAKSYQPYGEVLGSAGEGESSYGFTGEMQDATGLVYLRARYYQPVMARFLTQDNWAGNVNQPMSFNAWLYGYGNPVMMTDPTGEKPIPEDPCDHFPPAQQQICREGLYCGAFCPPAPIITSTTGANKTYKALLETPCEMRNGKLYPWWKSKGAEQKEYAPISSQMLVAVLVYTEGWPIGVHGTPVDQGAWTEALGNRYWYGCEAMGGCGFTNSQRTEIRSGLDWFLRFSAKFKGYGWTGIASSITHMHYGAPKWAYDLAGNIMNPSRRGWTADEPFGVMNSQLDAEQEYFDNVYKKSKPLSTEREGIYYRYGSGHKGDLWIMTWNQQKYHCLREDGTKRWPCGRNPVDEHTYGGD